MICSVCGRGDVPLYRANAKGQAAIWACEAHLAEKPAPEVERLVDAIAPTPKDPRR